MIYTIVFDSRSSKYDATDVEYNYYIVKHELEYLRAKLHHLGYLYLNQIYESLGMQWYPYDVNEFILDESFTGNKHPFTYKKDPDNNTIVIDIFIP